MKAKLTKMAWLSIIDKDLEVCFMDKVDSNYTDGGHFFVESGTGLTTSF